MTAPESIGSFIAELRLERLRRRLRQADLAEQLGTWPNRLSAWESGRVIPADSTLRAWAATLGLTVPGGVNGSLMVAAHGTTGGYSRHMRAKAKPCDPCRLAHNKALREWNRGKGRPQ